MYTKGKDDTMHRTDLLQPRTMSFASAQKLQLVRVKASLSYQNTARARHT